MSNKIHLKKYISYITYRIKEFNSIYRKVLKEEKIYKENEQLRYINDELLLDDGDYEYIELMNNKESEFNLLDINYIKNENKYKEEFYKKKRKTS